MSAPVTREITLPISKSKVALRDHITGRDLRAIDAVYYNGAKPDALRSETMEKADDVAAQACIISIDGEMDKDRIIEIWRDMPALDYKQVSAEVKKLVEPSLPEEKKTPSKGATSSS
jgi:hypothetical protein